MNATQPVAWDTETALIRPSLLSPPLVCLTWQESGEEAHIVDSTAAKAQLESWLHNPNKLLVGHNLAFDIAVALEAFGEDLEFRRAVFDAYDGDRYAHVFGRARRAEGDGRCTDTMIRAQLLDIAGGCYRGRVGEKGVWIKHDYTLEAVAKRYAGLRLSKDAWRLSYAEFLGLPLAGWIDRAKEVQERARAKLSELETIPHGGKSAEEKALKKEIEGLREMIASDPGQCIVYPLDDARATLAVFQAQERHATYLKDQFRQARGHFALYLSSVWGIRTDPEAVEKLRAQVTEYFEKLEKELQVDGLVKPDGVRNTKAAKRLMIEVCKEAGLPIRRTEGHAASGKCKDAEGNPLPDGHEDCYEHVCLDSDACKATEDPRLLRYEEFSEAKKVLSNDVEMLLQGVLYPLHPRYGLAETGRTTCSKPNIQNLRRFPGIRECIVPRPGKVFAQCDFPQLELYTLAQCCVKWVGFSKLAEALNAGLDPHLAMAAQILGISYEEAARRIEDEDVDNARQTAKVANFGFPGGLGIDKLILFAKKTYKVELTREQALALKTTWFETWPEMQLYFARINSKMVDGFADVESLFTERFRGGATYCAACNSGFQGLGADCAKNSSWLIQRAAYNELENALFNGRLVAFVHDEFIVEVDDTPAAHDAAVELARLMVEGANEFLPDVPIPLSKMKPLLMRRWSKKAKPVKDEEGRLVPWAA